MKKSETKIRFIFALMHLSCFLSFAQKQAINLWTAKNPFEQKNFIENAGQISSIDQFQGSKIKFEAKLNGIHYLFRNNGIIAMKYIKIEDSVNTGNESNSRKNAGDKRERERLPQIKPVYEMLDFKNPDSGVTISGADKVDNYYTYRDSSDKSGKRSFKAYAFKSITYSNIYSGVDLKLSFHPDSSSILMSFIVQPDIDPKVIQILFGQTTRLLTDHSGNLLISSSEFDLQLSKTQARQSDLKQDIISGFDITGNTVQFSGNKMNAAVQINTWLNSSMNLTGNNGAFDVDYDNEGGVYIYGGSDQYTLNKYDANGNLKWTTTPFGTDEYMYGDFAVDRSTGNIYAVEGIARFTYARVAKYDSFGSSLGVGSGPMIEIWRIAFDPCTHQGVMVCGNGHSSCYLDTALKVFSPIDPVYVDVGCLTIDNGGHCYEATTQNIAANYLYRFNISNIGSVTHSCLTGFNVNEYSSTYFHKPETFLGNGINALITSNDHVYSYDGFNLKRYDASNLNLLKSKAIETGDNSMLFWSGIAANNCDQLLIADKNKILHIDTAFNIVGTFTMPDYVYDIRYKNDGTVYVSGKSFVSVFNYDLHCMKISNIVLQPDSCKGFGSATISINEGTPPYLLTWNTIPVQTGTVVTNLNPGYAYITEISDSYQCLNENIKDTIQILSPVTYSLEQQIKSTSCTGINDGGISITPLGGSPPYFYNWANIISGEGINSLDSLSPGIYSLTVTDNHGCKASASIELPSVNNSLFMDYHKVNVFTPNDDGINDLFFPLVSDQRTPDQISSEINSYQLSIYNRWGTLVFESSRFKHTWDGYTTSGLKCSDGVYMWVLTMSSKCKDSVSERIKGWVELIR